MDTAMASRICLTPGLAVPFFPMRPRRGLALTPTSTGLVMTKMAMGHTVQRKLNGDRAILAMFQGRALMFNRHNTFLRHPVSNGAAFTAFPNSVFDGEVWQSKFYPFECLMFKDVDLRDHGPDIRASCAEKVCHDLKLPWMYKVTESWLNQEARLKHDLRSQWEGVVIKDKDSPYRVLGSETQESTSWAKLKWC